MISVLVPVYNEKDSIVTLYEELKESLGQKEYEIVFIDDGSTDGSAEVLKDLAKKDNRARSVMLVRNYGQTAAISAGFEQAKGEIIITIDGDLQNDSRDIGPMLDKMSEGYDLVSGWRKSRKDSRLRGFFSKAANRLISKVLGLELHDLGCTLKAYKRDVVKDLRLYGEMHRFIPYYVMLAGARIAEIEVTHRPRIRGASKYSISRVYKVLLDLVTVKFLISFFSRPMYFFGIFGLISLFLAAIIGIFVIVRNIFFAGAWVSPLLFLSMFLGLVGVMFILMGLQSELIMRTYYESQDKRPFLIREIVD
ncbi:MAG: glycosyltransferase family 2 protein [Candidatus Omnitrophica bacterium]|nr:glycosyltransferase family 2 protein [Candidatus Omnitrophota bacterium]